MCRFTLNKGKAEGKAEHGHNGPRLLSAGFSGSAGANIPDAKTNAKCNDKVKLAYFSVNFNDNATLTIT